MDVKCFVPSGFHGHIVSVEADLRKTIPGFDIVGLPDGAVRESKERIRIALRNCGFSFPQERILVNLSPAGVKKEGAAFDLPIALSILVQSGQIPPLLDNGTMTPVLAMGELNLSGDVKPVNGILPAIIKAAETGIRQAFVAEENILEAQAAGGCDVIPLRNLKRLTDQRSTKEYYSDKHFSVSANENIAVPAGISRQYGDYRDIKGQKFLKRAVEVAAAGRHNLFLFGPPGSGKTMAARRFTTLLPSLSRQQALEVSMIYSLAGKLDHARGLIKTPPFRMPHHTASQEGIIGGGKSVLPGEISLAHHGILFLDEAPEFRKSILQGLREPVEVHRVSIARAGQSYFFPADFQLIMAANPCPCGNLGRDEKICMCSISEIERYWKKLGGALLDRIDMRMPLNPPEAGSLMTENSENSAAIRSRVEKAMAIQDDRFRNEDFNRNSAIPPGKVGTYCSVNGEAEKDFTRAVEKLALSARACHSVLKIGRTIADLDGSDPIGREHLLEAVQHRRYGDGDYFWSQRF